MHRKFLLHVGFISAGAAVAAPVATLCLLFIGCVGEIGPGRATPAEAELFIENAEADLLDLWITASRASWVQSNFITGDTELLAAGANQQVIASTLGLAENSSRFDGLELPEDVDRKIKLLRRSLLLPAPSDPAKQKQLTEIASGLESDYGKGEYCPEGAQQECLDLPQLSRIMASSRDPQELLEAWRGWRTIAPAMRPRYERFVELANEGARAFGFADLGKMWLSNYDLPPQETMAEMDRLWEQVRPLYMALHAHVRASLAKQYGTQMVPEKGLIPAHLLGNMWSQNWLNIYPTVAPPQQARGFDLTQILKSRNVDEREMVRFGERFFVSLGFDPLPDTFWERSLFAQPADHDVVCHASAWDIDMEHDLRIKMCIEINEEDFATIHHELGHNFYQRAYSGQPPLFRSSANDAFHEAIGDTVALSVTPSYLQQIGLIDGAATSGGDLEQLMKMALDKVAFLPFGLLVDQWRWRVFSGEISPADYNKAWWDLRRKYQGIEAPIPRSEADFDPGAKYHIPANTPYSRYFFSSILQFQFHRALCREAGYEGPLHQCSIYDNAAAGERLRKTLAMGVSRPWQDALETLTGERQMDATAILDYFAPLAAWLEEQNQNRPVGF